MLRRRAREGIAGDEASRASRAGETAPSVDPTPPVRDGLGRAIEVVRRNTTMSKKIFALASITGLAGVVISTAGTGCTSEVVYVTVDGGGAGNGLGSNVDAGSGQDSGAADSSLVDARPSDAASDAPVVSGTCPRTTPIDATKFSYKPAAAVPGACTATMIDSLIAFVDGNKTAKYADVKASVTNAACHACLFTLDGATWGPLVENAKGELIHINSGGCIEVASGKLACGQAYHQFEQCLDEACAECPEGDDTALSACYKAAAKGACKAANTAITMDCADAISTCSDLSTKYTFEAPARALCVGLAP